MQGILNAWNLLPRDLVVAEMEMSKELDKHDTGRIYPGPERVAFCRIHFFSKEEKGRKPCFMFFTLRAHFYKL